MKLKYGKGFIDIETPPDFLGSIVPVVHKVDPVETLLKESFMDPVGLARLKDAVRRNRPHDVVVLVSDRTRDIANYEQILSFLVEELVDAGVDERNIEFVVALGTHHQHTPEDNERIYGALTRDFRITQHDCQGDTVSIGRTSTGLDVRVNRRVQEADYVVATGRVDFHYFAGYSGGRKSVLPGIASYDTIRNNHKKLTRDGVWIAQLHGNIIAREMAEAADLLGLDYLINVVETPDGNTERVFCGHYVHAFEEAVKYLSSARRVTIKERADCLVVSAGGFPNDRDFYHTQKSMNLAIAALKENGSIILIGQCEEGFGNEKFLQLMLGHELDSLLQFSEEKIDVGGHRAFVTARILKQHKVYALTSLDAELLRGIHFMPIQRIEQGFTAVKKEKGTGFKTIIVPNGRSALPLLNGKTDAFDHLGGLR
jgi:nickel-dependent lactate racemase